MELTAARFEPYPDLARKLLVKHVDLLRRLPLPFASLLLREAIHYDWKFPLERRDIESNFTYLRALPASEFDALMAPFGKIRLTNVLVNEDWVADPIAFSEKLSAHLWASHQIDGFRSAAVAYMDRKTAANPPQPPAVPRQLYVLVGEGSEQDRPTLFRKLLANGAYFSNVDTTGALALLLRELGKRADTSPEPFGHWYIDGGQSAVAPPGITALSYAQLTPIRAQLQRELKASYEGRIGSERMRSNLAQKKPEDFGLRSVGDRAVLDRFAIATLTEGSGTQIYSTTFVQWSVREALRRAQPSTMLVRFRPRQKERPMQELLLEATKPPALDPDGSLVDAEMGAYYAWINEQRLPGADQSSFLAVFEGGKQAVAIGPAMKKGQTSDSAIRLEELLAKLNGRAL